MSNNAADLELLELEAAFLTGRASALRAVAVSTPANRRLSSAPLGCVTGPNEAIGQPGGLGRREYP